MSTAFQSPLPTRSAPRRSSPRELGVFALPDGRKFVASALYAGGCCLYTLSAWNTFAVAEYRVDADGRLVHHGCLTRWGVEDLSDTGQTATYPGHRIL